MINKKVGDTVYYVPNDFRFGRTAKEITITKVGRKYTYAGDMSFVPWNYDGYAIGHNPESPHGQIYESRGDYEEMREWGRISNVLEKLNREQRKKVIDLVRALLA